MRNLTTWTCSEITKLIGTIDEPFFIEKICKFTGRSVNGLVENNKFARFLFSVKRVFQAKIVSTLNNRFIKADRSRTRNSSSSRRSHSSN